MTKEKGQKRRTLSSTKYYAEN